MKIIYKLIMLVIVIAVFLTGCSNNNNESTLDLSNADFVVFETSLQKSPSYMVTYDKSGNKLNSIDVDCTGLNYDWSTNAQIVDSIAYLSTGKPGCGSASEKAVTFDLNTGAFKVFDGINPWMLSVTGNGKYIFGMNTIAGENGFGATIARYDMQTKQRDQIDIEYPGRCIAYDNNNLYVVCEPKKSDEQEKASLLFVLNAETKEIENTIKLPECGEVTGCLVSNGLVYIPPINKTPGNCVEEDKNTKVFVANPKNGVVETIDTGIVAPHYIQEYNDNLLVLNDPGNGADYQNEPHEHHITMINKSTHEVVKDYQFEFEPATIQVKGDELYVTDSRSFLNRHDDQNMCVYSLPDFQLKRRFVITPQHGDDFYLTKGFITIQ